MDELGQWFMEVFTSVNGSGRLAPPAASKKRVSALMEQIGGEGVLQIAALLNIGDGDAVLRLAGKEPELGQRLKAEESQEALDQYFADRSGFFEPYRRFATRGLGLAPGSTVVSFASTVDPAQASGAAWEKVFQLLVERKDDGQESNDI